MIGSISIIAAFTAGLVSFLAPCVLPIIPGFLAYLAGTSTVETGPKRKEIFINSAFFVLGFSGLINPDYVFAFNVNGHLLYGYKADRSTISKFYI